MSDVTITVTSQCFGIETFEKTIASCWLRCEGHVTPIPNALLLQTSQISVIRFHEKFRISRDIAYESKWRLAFAEMVNPNPITIWFICFFAGGAWFHSRYGYATAHRQNPYFHDTTLHESRLFESWDFSNENLIIFKFGRIESRIQTTGSQLRCAAFIHKIWQRKSE